MKLSEFKKALSEHSDKNIQFQLPTGTKIPVHAHVTDVARNDKQFIDCGGTIRTESNCRLQVWFADDTDHRIGATMLLKVLGKAPFLGEDDLDVDVEYEAPFISQFPVTSMEIENQLLLVHLGVRHTTCLAQDRCLPPQPKETPMSFKVPPSFSSGKCC